MVSNLATVDKPNRYGLVRLEGVDYACDCLASGTDTKGNKIVKSDRWAHERTCSLFKRKAWSEYICDCREGSTINNDGSITVHPSHARECPIFSKLVKDSVAINPFFGGYVT